MWKIIGASFVGILAACTHASGSAEQKKECLSGDPCKVSGLLTMSTDGHGYIGKLDVGNGKCLNVSLPDATSRKTIYKPARSVTLRGRWLPYVKQENIQARVNGRTVGEGLCGDHYLFVKD